MQIETAERYDRYERAEYEAWEARRNTRGIKDIDQITINAIQQRANKYGFALAMREPPTKYAQIQHAARTLNDIITNLDQ